MYRPGKSRGSIVRDQLIDLFGRLPHRGLQRQPVQPLSEQPGKLDQLVLGHLSPPQKWPAIDLQQSAGPLRPSICKAHLTSRAVGRHWLADLASRINTDRLTVHVLAAVAEHEAAMISARTKAALKAAKARGVKLGNPANLRNQLDGSARGNAAKAAKADKRAADLLPLILPMKADGA